MNSSRNGSEALRCRVRGRVQGVFFRASAQRTARALGIVGYARNLSDGSVEVLAIGPASALSELRAWLDVGPPQARVTAVDYTPESLPDPLPGEFSTR
jgi:acylphosphatase